MVLDSSDKIARWCLGPPPKSLDAESVEIIRQLFLDQTGERYASALTKINLSNKVYRYFGKINLKDYIKDFLRKNS